MTTITQLKFSTVSVEDAAKVNQLFWDGMRTSCPCCFRNIAPYKWRMSAKYLPVLYHLKYCGEDGEDGGTMAKWSGGGSHAKPHFWGLTTTENPAGIVPGEQVRWWLTNRGRRFLENRVRVPKSLIIYNSTVIAEDDELINVKQARADDPSGAFDYVDMTDPAQIRKVMGL